MNDPKIAIYFGKPDGRLKHVAQKKGKQFQKLKEILFSFNGIKAIIFDGSTNPFRNQYSLSYIKYDDKKGSLHFCIDIEKQTTEEIVFQIKKLFSLSSLVT